MNIYDMLMNLIEVVCNLFQKPTTTITPKVLTEHQQNRVAQLKDDIEKLKTTNNLNINKMYQAVSKINRRINKQTDIVIIIKFIENELRDFNLMRQIEPELNDITVESIEKNTILLDMKDKFTVLLSIKDKEDKINRIMYGVQY